MRIRTPINQGIAAVDQIQLIENRNVYKDLRSEDINFLGKVFGYAYHDGTGTSTNVPASWVESHLALDYEKKRDDSVVIVMVTCLGQISNAAGASYYRIQRGTRNLHEEDNPEYCNHRAMDAVVPIHFAANMVDRDAPAGVHRYALWGLDSGNLITAMNDGSITVLEVEA
jgi:hypothetical protein